MIKTTAAPGKSISGGSSGGSSGGGEAAAAVVVGVVEEEEAGLLQRREQEGGGGGVGVEIASTEEGFAVDHDGSGGKKQRGRVGVAFGRMKGACVYVYDGLAWVWSGIKTTRT